MKLNITWPTAVVLAVFISAWVALAALHVAVPTWMVVAGAVVGKTIVAITQGITGGAGSAGSATPNGSNTPPAGG